MTTKPIKPFQVNAWRAALSASHRGPRPGKTTVQKPPKIPNFNAKVRFK